MADVEDLSVGAPLRARAAAVVLALFGLAVGAVALRARTAPGQWFTVVVTVLALVSAVRLWCLAVRDRGDALLVRNAFRSHRVRWADLVDVEVDYQVRPWFPGRSTHAPEEWTTVLWTGDGRRVAVEARSAEAGRIMGLAGQPEPEALHAWAGAVRRRMGDRP